VFGAGWGCDSGRYTWWIAPGATKKQSVPSCVPFPDGTGAVAPTPVKWVPTLMDSMDKAGLTYKLYAGSSNITPGVAFQASGYQWAICPTFADCGQTSQRSHMVVANKVLTDAAAGTLPAVSIVTPTGHNSQHNGNSMLNGDNWIGSVVSAIQNGPNWASTAIFITYDDCGCFYDHVAPPAAGLGPRMPLVIVSPYAIAGHTDSNVANMASFMAYIEHNFGLAPLGTADAAAYNYSGSFNYAQTPLLGARMVTSALTPYQATLNEADPTDTT
jgi:phospholipase C